MMARGWWVFLSMLVFAFVAKGQTSGLRGEILDEKGAGLGFATVALLHPADSTLAFFGITNVKGQFEIRNIRSGEYLMQTAYIGYRTAYRKISLPLKEDGVFGALVMEPAPLNLREVEVSGEHIPLLIKKDTIEYNAAAFKTKPDAVAEELIRKLPGVEVDRAGNIKAVGEDVKKVLVDGKEFFGNDLKVATKNVPADAVKKVQVYDKRSEESDFTGISDGSHDKTMNLVLKDDRKKGIFGDLMAGGGTHNHYQANARVYRFTGADQFAVLGMINNINQFGFSFSDYLSFNGGLAMSGGGGSVRMSISGENDFPVNFGQAVNGFVTSGAAGVNFSHEFRKNNRIYLSYLGNGSGVNLDQEIYSRNFLPGSSFIQQKGSSSDEANQAHRINFGWKNRLDSLQNLVISGNAALTTNRSSGASVTGSFRNDSLINSLENSTNDGGKRFSGNLAGSWIRKLNGDQTNLKITGRGEYSHGLNNLQWQNITQYYDPDFLAAESQYQHSLTSHFGANLSVTVTQKIGQFYLEPLIAGGFVSDHLYREQGIPDDTGGKIDSLSPDFRNRYQSLEPALRLKRNTQKTNLSVTAGFELGRLTNNLDGGPDISSNVLFFTPEFNVEYAYSQGKRITFAVNSQVVTPTSSQLLPVSDNRNPLAVTTGNRNLVPEYRNDVGFNWLNFDQFSFTSIFASLDFNYTRNKINWSQTVNDSLGQQLTLVNVPDDYTASASVDFSTPIRLLGLTVHASLRESWNQGITLVNGVENINTNLTHRLSLTFDNRIKVKWDVNMGVAATLTNARYSVEESLNNRYFDLAVFGELRYTPAERWSFSMSADVTSYNAKTFNDLVIVPLIGAEATFYFLKNNRGMLSLSGFDLLNRNTGIERVSDMNYLRETRSNIIGRYIMLSFKYRLNKFKENKGVEINVNNRR